MGRGPEREASETKSLGVEPQKLDAAGMYKFHRKSLESLSLFRYTSDSVKIYNNKLLGHCHSS